MCGATRITAVVAAVLAAMCLPCPAPGAQGPSFPALRHGLKAVFGKNGNDHGGDLEDKGERLAESFRDLGVNLTRIEFKWAIIEPVPGTYDWSEPDRLISFLDARGIEPMLMMYCAPKWAMRGSPADEQLFIARGERNLHTVVWPRRAFLPDFVRFCQTAARRYAGKARLFEFWNEPDGMAGPIVLHDRQGRAVDVRYGGDAAEYTYWLKAMYGAVKRGNPDARVAAGSLCVHDLNFMRAIYAAGGKDSCDAISLHPYADDGVNIEWIKQVRGVMTRYGDWAKPIWLTEFGWQHGAQYNNATRSWSPAADDVARLIAATFPRIIELPYVTHSFFFTLNDWQTGQPGIDPVGTHSFGLVDLSFQRRPGFETFRRAVADAPRGPRRGETPISTIAPPPGPVDLAPDGSLRIPMICFHPTAGPRTAQGRPPIRDLTVEAGGLFKRPVRTSLRLPDGPAGPCVCQTAVAGDVAPGTWPARATLAGAPPVEFPVAVPASAHRRRHRPPRVDANLDDWDDRLGIQQGRMAAGFAWDDQHLYFACRVTDLRHQQTYRDKNLWKGDCVQVAFDPKRDAIRGSRYDVNDSEFALALTSAGPLLWRYACPLESYVGALPPGLLAARRVGDETLYEAAIPWIEIGLDSVQAGQLIGVAVAGCDWTDSQRTVHRFGDGVIGGKEPYRFASIRLVDAGGGGHEDGDGPARSSPGP